MMRYEVRSEKDALVYLTDCCLATVAKMAMLKSRKVLEFKRQISIAQIACDWLGEFHISPGITRARDIIGICTVQEWAEQFIKEEID